LADCDGPTVADVVVIPNKTRSNVFDSTLVYRTLVGDGVLGVLRGYDAQFTSPGSCGKAPFYTENVGRVPVLVTGGGTDTFEIDLVGGVYTEIQPGSYPFMDREYTEIDWAAGRRSWSALAGASPLPWSPILDLNEGHDLADMALSSSRSRSRSSS
jgi:hypothetical protein